MSLPTLIVHTTYFEPDGREEAASLGAALYERITGPPADPLAHGAGIPVMIATHADRLLAGGDHLHAAERVVLVPILGPEAFQDRNARRIVIDRIAGWRKRLGEPHVLPVPLARPWRNLEHLGGDPFVHSWIEHATDEHATDESRWRVTLDEIVVSLCRLLAGPDTGEKTTLFLSYAKADLDSTQDSALQIHRHVARSADSPFFDKVHLLSGESPGKQLADLAGPGVFVAIRSDTYGSRAWCQQALLGAKRRGLPTLTVEVLSQGERRSSTYGGNGPTAVWKGDPAAVASRALVEWLRALHFDLEARRVIRDAALPEGTVCLPRPPELLDLAQGPVPGKGAVVVLHPDPELPSAERTVLLRAQPRLRLVTPTTAYRRLLGPADAPSMEAPLGSALVAISISDSPDVDGADGYTSAHVRGATVHLIRTLIGAGARIASGGDFRNIKYRDDPKGTGFTELLISIIETYNLFARSEADFLHSFVPGALKSGDAGVTRHEINSDLPPWTESDAPERWPYQFSAARKMMAKECDYRIVLAGQTSPETSNAAGYKGRYPGVAEEAWWTLRSGKPLYVIGGFGGAAAAVARVLRGEEAPAALLDSAHALQPEVSARWRALEEHPDRQILGLPASMAQLVSDLRLWSADRLASDEAALAWNGLDVAANLRLFAARDPLTISTLILRGMLRTLAGRLKGRLAVDLVCGEVSDVREVDAIAVAAFSDVELDRSALALDERLGGLLKAARIAGHRLTALPDTAIDAEWLILPDLGRLAAPTSLEGAVRAGAAQTAEMAQRCGFRRIALTLFGGNLGADLRPIAEAVVDEMARVGDKPSLVWVEPDADRFEKLEGCLKSMAEAERVSLTTRRVAREVSATPGDPCTILSVHSERDHVSISVLPAQGAAALFSERRPLDADGWKALVGPYADAAEVRRRGIALADSVLGASGVKAVNASPGSRLVVVHDRDCAAFPFELLWLDGMHVAINAGVVRRPSLPGLVPDRLFARSVSTGPLRVLMVVDPLDKLASADEEADQIKRMIAGASSSVQLYPELRGKRATRDAVRAALATPDLHVFHFIGDGFLRGSGPHESGICCADGDLTVADLASTEIHARLAFVNACRTAPIGGEAEPGDGQARDDRPLAFAEIFLRSGIEAYLGTSWKVRDSAAADFAIEVYQSLTRGGTLGEAVRQARKVLHEDGEADWANYVLYGDGTLRFRMPATRGERP